MFELIWLIILYLKNCNVFILSFLFLFEMMIYTLPKIIISEVGSTLTSFMILFFENIISIVKSEVYERNNKKNT